MQVAVGLVDLKDHTGKFVYDKTIANLVVYRRTFIDNRYVYEELRSRSCTKEDLGVDQNRLDPEVVTKFWPFDSSLT